MLVAKELPAIVLVTAMGQAIVQVVVLVLGTSLLSIITGFTSSTGTGSINMPTVKEAKIPELNCPQQEQTCFLITLLTSGMTVSAFIRTALELDCQKVGKVCWNSTGRLTAHKALCISTKSTGHS